MARLGTLALIGLALATALLLGVSRPAAAAIILEAHFDGGTDDFTYVDDAFRGTARPAYASGTWTSLSAPQGGVLQVDLGGVDNTDIKGMSGGWRATFALSAANKLVLNFRANLTMSEAFEFNEWTQILVSVDGRPRLGAHLIPLTGFSSPPTTGWKLFQVQLGHLTAGTHEIVIGAWLNKKTHVDETVQLLLDDVALIGTEAGAVAAVAALDFDRFKANIATLASFGDRRASEAPPVSNVDAGNWIESQLLLWGYTVERHQFPFGSGTRDNIYATKVGTVFPDQMYIVSAHFDGRGGGGAANDDASGCSLVLEAARVLAGLQTAVSVRFVFWNAEEQGLVGSTAYVDDRVALQGVESSPGSGLYPEPTWLGIIQHDQILFDHGLPPEEDQIAGADIDIEYQEESVYAAQSLLLANRLFAGNQTYSTFYPAEVGSDMSNTDSMPFRDHTAAVSVRDNQRLAEIGMGANPHWHEPTDVYATYSEDDFLLGFNIVQMTVGTVAELAGAH